MHPRREERFAAAIHWFAIGPGYEISPILKGFIWARLGEAIVVDVGGSHRSLSIALAVEFPHLSCIVQDRSGVIKVGETHLPSSLLSRVSFMDHDFFAIQPVKAAAVYVLRWTLQDWSDPYATIIMRALVPALAPSSKILICEFVLSDPNTSSTVGDRNARYVSFPFIFVPMPSDQRLVLRAFDFGMLELFNGKERILVTGKV